MQFIECYVPSMYFHYDEGFAFEPLYVETTEKGHFPSISQTYETSDASQPISTYRDLLYVGARRAKRG
eukprot:5757336-Ditylum_brightwellii.AAC.1